MCSLPVILVPAMSSTPASDGSAAVCGDLSMGADYVNRRAVNFKLLTECCADADQIGIRATSRFNVQVVNPEVLRKITIA
ncbi:MAG: phage major capsid protein [Planctomycetota bacterium]|nr:phage major capsid protein [Planctomycetota bacterium]